MKILSACVASAIVLFSAGAQQANALVKETVFRVFTDVVDPSNQQAFEAAIKTYSKCLADHKFTGSMRAYGGETGNTYKYTFVMGLQNWNALDGMSDVAKACGTGWRSAGNAHLKSETSLILAEVPELSYLPQTREMKPALVNVTTFVLKDSSGVANFLDSFTKLRASAVKSTWPGNYILYEVRGGDSAAPAYVMVSSYKGWTEYGAGGRSEAMKMFATVNGQDNVTALTKTISDTVAKTSSHVDSYIESLSYVPAQ